MSVPPPGAYPTMMRTGRDGYACAQAIGDAAGSAAAPAARCRNCLRWGSFILTLPLASHHSTPLVGAAGYGLYVFAPAGRRTVKTEPLPGSLATVTSPPIMRASLRVMARPSPEPPKR